ncbi:MAG: hypothetical protein NXI04_13830 [Planctomycetaceae bacterium]|nr:hypothetical protein [Planctomycetaceae bacterium]
MSTDNPFAAPTSLDERGNDANFAQVAGDVLLCGREVDLSAVGWLTGQPTTADERRHSKRLRLVYWPIPLRRLVWVLPIVVVLSNRVLAGNRQLVTLGFFATWWLWLPLLSRFRPTTCLTIAFTRQGRSLRTRHNVSQTLRAILAVAVAMLALEYADIADAALPKGLWVLKYILMPVGGFALVMWGWNLIFPPVLKLRPPTVKAFSAGVFSIHDAPAGFLDGLSRLLDAESRHSSHGQGRSTPNAAAAKMDHEDQ